MKNEKIVYVQTGNIITTLKSLICSFAKKNNQSDLFYYVYCYAHIN